MDMPDSSSDSSMSMMMVPYLHFTGGDNLFFKGLHPSSAGALAGASLVLFCIAILERYVSAQRSLLEGRWRSKTRAAVTTSAPATPADDGCEEKETEQSVIVEAECRKLKAAEPTPSRFRRTRTFAPFMLYIELFRGGMFALQTLLAYLLMIAIMTYQAAYLIAIVAGSGFGEMFFGRWKAIASGAVLH